MSLKIDKPNEKFFGFKFCPNCGQPGCDTMGHGYKLGKKGNIKKNYLDYCCFCEFAIENAHDEEVEPTINDLCSHCAREGGYIPTPEQIELFHFKYEHMLLSRRTYAKENPIDANQEILDQF